MIKAHVREILIGSVILGIGVAAVYVVTGSGPAGYASGVFASVALICIGYIEGRRDG